jgi:hypothetical protein
MPSGARAHDHSRLPNAPYVPPSNGTRRGRNIQVGMGVSRLRVPIDTRPGNEESEGVGVVAKIAPLRFTNGNVDPQ